MPPDRVTATIRILSTGQELKLEYKYPMVDVSGSTRTKTFSPIGADPVVQELGSDPIEKEMRGHCYYDEKKTIDGLSQNARIELVSEYDSCFGVVKSHNTTHTKRKGGQRAEHTHENKNFDYRIRLIETAAPALDPPES